MALSGRPPDSCEAEVGRIRAEKSMKVVEMVLEWEVRTILSSSVAHPRYSL